MSEILHLHYDVDGEDFVSCGHASEDVRRTLKSIGISGEVIRKVSIAMYEGEINMVIHADGGVADVSICEDSIVVTLSEGFSTATDEIRELGFGAGMGLPNMKKYSDSMVIESEVGKGTVVTLKFNL